MSATTSATRWRVVSTWVISKWQLWHSQVVLEGTWRTERMESRGMHGLNWWWFGGGRSRADGSATGSQ